MKFLFKFNLICFTFLLITGCNQKNKTPEGALIHKEANVPAGNNLRLLAGRAGIVFKGVVSKIEYETDIKTNQPYTYVTFRQIEAIKDMTGKFKGSLDDRIKVRNFGGLREDGTMVTTSMTPEFILGGVYLVFYTAGDWDITPIVDGKNGIFQVLKSKTLGHDMLINASGQVLVSVDNDSIKSASLDYTLSEQISPLLSNQNARITNIQNKESSTLVIRPNNIYSEENVKNLIENEEQPSLKLERPESINRQNDSLKVQYLRSLSPQPLSVELFSKSIVETDKKHQGDFGKFYSKVNFDGKLVQREKTPVAPKQ